MSYLLKRGNIYLMDERKAILDAEIFVLGDRLVCEFWPKDCRKAEFVEENYLFSVETQDYYKNERKGFIVIKMVRCRPSLKFREELLTGPMKYHYYPFIGFQNRDWGWDETFQGR